MLTSRQRVPGAARAATRLFSASASSAAPPPAGGGKKSTASQAKGKNAQKAKPQSQRGAQQTSRPPASPQDAPGHSPWLDLLSRSAYLRDHPKYQEVVSTLSQEASKDLGRKVSLNFKEDGNKTTIESGRSMDLDPDTRRRMLQNIRQGLLGTDANPLAGLPSGMADKLEPVLLQQLQEELEAEEGAEEDEDGLAAAEENEFDEDDAAEENEMEEEEEEDEEDEEDEGDEEDSIPSPFLEGEDQAKFNPLSMENIDPEPTAMSSVGFQLISIQRQFLHYMRLIEGDMFMLQGLRQQFKPPTEKNPLIVRTMSYGQERHPVTRKRTITVPVALLPLTSDAATHKIRLIAGPRWTQRPPTDSGVGIQEDGLWGFHGYIKISCEDFPEPVQNLKFASDTLDKLVEEANNVQDFMTDIPLDERHVAAFYRRKTGYDRFGHRASLDDFPVDWLHIAPEVHEHLADADAEVTEHLYDDQRLDPNVPIAVESKEGSREFIPVRVQEDGTTVPVDIEREEAIEDLEYEWLHSDGSQPIDYSVLDPDPEEEEDDGEEGEDPEEDEEDEDDDEEDEDEEDEDDDDDDDDDEDDEDIDDEELEALVKELEAEEARKGARSSKGDRRK